jgi:hypothetical protein
VIEDDTEEPADDDGGTVDEPDPGLPEAVPDDWLDQKPFDPAGR